jgi:hypothetical protein
LQILGAIESTVGYETAILILACQGLAVAH